MNNQRNSDADGTSEEICKNSDGSSNFASIQRKLGDSKFVTLLVLHVTKQVALVPIRHEYKYEHRACMPIQQSK